MSRQLFLVAYDVRHPRRLQRVHQVLKDYACGGQKSAFECYLSAGELRELISRIDQIMDAEEDSFLVIRLASRDAVETLGKAVKPADEFYTYLG
ncbi:CRISPR-associated endonuclease Cas2 [Saccharophagus sp. K07]|uniref:CRISPR-associated endonuclease Cas2 n=1 Tax=Saccharophagus sp. K07 TaxID=2283636 RepID=UPI001651E122|nr:CRISPR-associated endonuclease Cas2 [Saccharophagus sp. K07]MBC6907362.1 CRISPR-associated endonuclease Cas2 [Saccharophagus sp. K07]